MAGDWIKFEKSTLDKPEVFEIAEILGIDPDAVVGKLLRVWNWFDDQSDDGNASVTVKLLLDRYSGVPKFTDAMESVGWLEIEGGIMKLPNFDRHNGTTAKKRCNTNRRVAKSRANKQKCNTQSVTNVTGKALQKALQKALPEKRREEKSNNNTPLPPKGGCEIPSKEEFISHLLEELPKINADWTADRIQKAAELQYETLVDNKWRDGNNKPVKNWRLKVKNIMIHKKPWNYGGGAQSSSRTQGTCNEAQLFGAGKNPNQPKPFPTL